jgi:vitamin B12 transporter
LCALAAPPAWAQTDAEPAQQIVVSATRVPARLNDLVADVTVISRAALQRSEARTLVELLSQQAGLQFSSNGGLGKPASLFIRGLEARHTLLLVDGVPLGSATLGTPSLDNLPLESIERIEIVRGPMSSLYGNGALGGVVQVITRKGAQGFTANAKLAGGSNNHAQAAAGLTWGEGAFDAAAQVQHTRTQGISATNERVPFNSFNPDLDGFRQTGGSLRLGWQPAEQWRLELLALASNGLTRFDDGAVADARAKLRNELVAVSAAGQLLPAWRSSLRLSQAVDGFDTLESANGPTALGLIKTDRRLLSWDNSLGTPVGTLLVLAERTQEDVSRPGAPFSVSERSITGLALGLTGAAAGHTWQASARRDSNSQFGGITTGALAYGFSFSPAWLVGASYGTSQTLPSFNQLYFPGFGNPNLLPEEGEHAEVSLRYSAGAQRVRLAYYDYNYRGFISSGPQPLNLPRAEISGVTLSYEGQWRALKMAASLDHVDPRNATRGSAAFDKQLPRRAKNALRLAADWEAPVWSAGASFSAFSHRFDNATNTTRLAGYGVLDLRADWAVLPDLRWGLRINNAADKRFETALGYDQPGREAFVSLRYVLR